MIKEAQNTWNVISLMSGTSLDGLDIAYVKFTSKANWSFEIMVCETLDYSFQWRNKLQYRSNFTDSELEELDREYGNHLAHEIQSFRNRHKIPKGEVDFISSHGHTIFHKPEIGFTKQIGNGPQVFAKENIPVVCDFRVQDVLLGGQGAPLVPMGDQLLFSEFDACINLGGFANISFENEGQRLALDICPLNYVSNDLAKKIGLEYDRAGLMAQQGELHFAMLEEFNKLEYYHLKGPKTLGAEWVEQYIQPILDRYNLQTRDSLRTFMEHASGQIAKLLKQQHSKKALFTGGGVYNSFFMDLVKQKSECEIVIPSKEIIEFKEALIFGLLGLLKYKGEVNILSTVTGARHNHSSGKIYQ